MTRVRHVPQRSCIACRQVRSKGELIRMVRTPLGELRVDETGKVAGRGAYVCRNERCIEGAVKQKRLVRALGVAIGPEVVEELRSQVAAAVGRAEPEGKASDK